VAGVGGCEGGGVGEVALRSESAKFAIVEGMVGAGGTPSPTRRIRSCGLKGMVGFTTCGGSFERLAFLGPVEVGGTLRFRFLDARGGLVLAVRLEEFLAGFVPFRLFILLMAV
jgi:hypothetical protein